MFESDETFQPFVFHRNSFMKNRFVETSIIIRTKALVHIIKLAQATTELDSGASVEPFPFPIGERFLHAALINNSLTTPI
jgi:hypothetical protein